MQQPTPFARRQLLISALAGLAGLTSLSCLSSAAVAEDILPRVPLVLPARSLFVPTLPTPEHLRLLHQGGLVVYLRHGPSNAKIPDQLPVQLGDCSTQRPLTEAGRHYLDQTGRHIALMQLPYQGVISSPFCRVKESAQRVFGSPVLVDEQLRYTAAMPAAEKRPAVERTRYWLSLPVAEPGLNRIVAAHGPNLAELMDYLPPEGTVLFFRPLGLDVVPSFEYLSSISPGQWDAALQALGLQ